MFQQTGATRARRAPAWDPDSRRAADLCVPVLYLAALPIPPVGSTLVWLVARVVTGERALDRHYVCALRMQLLACAAIAGLQAFVAGVIWLSGPAHGAPPIEALCAPLLTADLVVSFGLLLAPAVLGPLLHAAPGGQAGPGRAADDRARARPNAPPPVEAALRHAHGHGSGRPPLRTTDVAAAAEPAAPPPNARPPRRLPSEQATRPLEPGPGGAAGARSPAPP